MNLKERKAVPKRGELRKKLFLSELPFREATVVFVVSVDKTFHDDAPLCCVGLGRVDEHRQQANDAVVSPLRRSEGAPRITSLSCPDQLAWTFECSVRTVRGRQRYC